MRGRRERGGGGGGERRDIYICTYRPPPQRGEGDERERERERGGEKEEGEYAGKVFSPLPTSRKYLLRTLAAT